MSDYLRLILDSIFGIRNFRNEVIWCYTVPSNSTKCFPRKHDIIFIYNKSMIYVFNSDSVRVPYAESSNKRAGHKATGFLSGCGIIKLKDGGKVVEDFWTDICTSGKITKERNGYPTQKPEALLERIIKASTNE